jgi:ABC-type dipeptide/oligopeptide/nickel transport system permease component
VASACPSSPLTKWYRFTTLAAIVGNLIADISYAVLDPRVRCG